GHHEAPACDGAGRSCEQRATRARERLAGVPRRPGGGPAVSRSGLPSLGGGAGPPARVRGGVGGPSGLRGTRPDQTCPRHHCCPVALPGSRLILVSQMQETITLDRLLDPVGRCLTPEVARRLVALRAEPELQARVDLL